MVNRPFGIENYLQLGDIEEIIGVTAVDVFVYNTALDSDGGAWRKRTHHTSWYNETLNTATRGSRREFPAVAVIVAEAGVVRIYDGDDPSLPMWMAFTLNNQDQVSIAALNGIVALGNKFVPNASFGGNGLNVLDFAGDRWRHGMANGSVPWLVPEMPYIKSGNMVTWFEVTSTGLQRFYQLRHYIINDITMTVLPDAPTDPATGLPVPTIAVATTGGVSVIKDDGTVADSASTLAMGTIGFDDDNGLWYSRNVASHLLFYSTRSDYEAGDGFGDPVADDNSNAYSFPLLTRTNRAAVASEIYIGGNSGAISYVVNGLMIHQPNYADQTKGMSALLTSTYNTGWMNGAIKGAFLSDTDDTDLVGSGELVTNGTFATNDDTGWTRTIDNGWDFSGGAAAHTGATGGRIRQAITCVSGATYILTFTLDATADTSLSNTSIGIRNSTDTTFVASAFVIAPTANVVKDYSVTFVANSTTQYVAFYSEDDVTLDNVSVKLADADRSVNNNGLIVNGTVTRTAVATGADLVAYSGFSSSNYLEQPYNSALDFGTGDFCVMGWVKQNSTVTAQIAHRADIAGVGGGVLSVWNSSVLGLSLDISDDNLATKDTVNEGSQSPTGVWRHAAFVRSGSNIQCYINGVLKNTNAVSNATGSLNNSAAVLRVGLATGGGYPLNGSLALWRISATAPTADQIAKIYNDEKVLFQENAQATLYGTSDAVTALAHDPVTDLLHVGTSAGRSVFSGLRRVSNTTTAVGTAISASNGMIAEE